MEKRAREFLDITSRYYERNKVKWDGLIKALGLQGDEYVVDNQNLYFVTINLILSKVWENYDPQTYHLFKMYYLIPDMTFEELSSIVDVKPKISRVRKWLVNEFQ